MADWDADDFEPDTATAPVATMPSDKWDGEDEEDDIKVRIWSPHENVHILKRTVFPGCLGCGVR